VNGTFEGNLKLVLPDRRKIPLDQAYEQIKCYERMVVALFDRTNTGPHDQLEPIDLLSLNALNAFVGSNPTSAMAELWVKRKRVEAVTAGITKQPIESLSDKLLASEISKIAGWFRGVEDIRFWKGGVRSSKLFHRLRPNVGAIWDKKVSSWYPRNINDKNWVPWLRRVFHDLRQNRIALGAIQKRLRSDPEIELFLYLPRIWDILLWSLAPSRPNTE